MASANAPDESCQNSDTCGATHNGLCKRLDENGRSISALERGQRAIGVEISKLNLTTSAISKSVSDLAEDYGLVLRHVTSIDSKIDASISTNQALFSKLQEIHLDLSKQQLTCNSRHKDIDDRFDSLGDEDDVLDVDTSVFAQMSGIEVKTLIAEEKRERQALQAKVDAMAHRDKIHEAQKAAVESARVQWENEQSKAEEEQRKAIVATKNATDETAKLKTARYGMYATIAVAIIGAIASMTIAVMNLSK